MTRSHRKHLPLTLRVISGAWLAFFGLASVNWAFWQLSFFGLSQKQMLMLPLLPGIILSFYIRAWMEGPGANE